MRSVPYFAAAVLTVFALEGQARSAAPPAPVPEAAPPAVAASAEGKAHADRHAAKMSLQQRFDAANTTHDGRLTLEQASAGMPRVAKHFQAIDTEGKGYVTFEQIHAFNALQRHAHDKHAG